MNVDQDMEEPGAGDAAEECELCGDPALGRFVLTLDLDRDPRFPPDLEEAAQAQERTLYELYVCRLCLLSTATPCVICELAAQEVEMSDDEKNQPARVVDMFEALYDLSPAQRGALLRVAPKKLQAALALFWKNDTKLIGTL